MFLLPLVVTLAPAAPLPGTGEAFLPQILVRARVTRAVTAEDGRSQTTEWTIDYVYAGKPTLKGRGFTFSCLTEIPFTRANPRVEYIGPPFKVGEVGLWWLYPEKDDARRPILSPCIMHGGGMSSGTRPWMGAFPVPARRAILYTEPVSYAAALKWARTVEEVYRADAGERPRLLKRLCRSANPYVACWAVELLCRYKPAGLAAFLEDLSTKDDVCLPAQFAIDDSLCDLEPNEWHRSRHRQALLERWLSGDVVDDRDLRALVTHLRSALRNEQLGWKAFYPLLTRWIAEQDLPAEYGEELLPPFPNPEAAWALPWRADFVRFLLKRAAAEKDPERQGLLARWLESCPLTADEVKAVRDLATRVMRPEVRERLQELAQAWARYPKRAKERP
jgi:hypothetical protein